MANLLDKVKDSMSDKDVFALGKGDQQSLSFFEKYFSDVDTRKNTYAQMSEAMAAYDVLGQSIEQVRKSPQAGQADYISRFDKLSGKAVEMKSYLEKTQQQETERVQRAKSLQQSPGLDRYKSMLSGLAGE